MEFMKNTKSNKSKESRRSHSKAELDRQAFLVKTVIKLQRYYRARRAKKDFENYQHTLILRNKVIARGLRVIRNIRWFVNIYKRDDDKSIVSRLALSQHSSKNMLNSTNVIVEVLPMQSGVAKPMPSHYNEREICEILKVWNLNGIEEALQNALLGFVDIEEGVVKIKRKTNDSEIPQKRLLDSIKAKLSNGLDYKVRIYEIFENEEFSIEIKAIREDKMLSLNVTYELLMQKLLMSSKEDLTTRLKDVMDLVRVHSDGNSLIIQ